MDEGEKQKLEKVVDQAIMKLMEHFDTVQIFVTRFSGADEETFALHKGDGDWYARYGLVRMWLIREEVNDERS